MDWFLYDRDLRYERVQFIRNRRCHQKNLKGLSNSIPSRAIITKFREKEEIDKLLEFMLVQSSDRH